MCCWTSSCPCCGCVVGRGYRRTSPTDHPLSSPRVGNAAPTANAKHELTKAPSPNLNYPTYNTNCIKHRISQLLSNTSPRTHITKPIGARPPRPRVLAPRPGCAMHPGARPPQSPTEVPDDLPIPRLHASIQDASSPHIQTAISTIRTNTNDNSRTHYQTM